MNLKVGDYAFWEYGGKFCRYLGNRITAVGTDEIIKSWNGFSFTVSRKDKVEVQGFGEGYWFKPLFTLPAGKGKRLLKELKFFEDLYREREKRLHADYDEVMDLLLGDYGVEIKKET